MTGGTRCISITSGTGDLANGPAGIEGIGSVMTGGPGLTGFIPGGTGVPQTSQNFTPGSSGDPQDVHDRVFGDGAGSNGTGLTGAPHDSQNFVPGESRFPHIRQLISP